MSRSLLFHVGHGDMPAFIALEEGVFINDTEVPVGWIIEFQELPENIKSKVALVGSLEEVNEYRHKLDIHLPNLGIKGKLQ